jgi:branched-chain amino acid transport system permease protein
MMNLRVIQAGAFARLRASYAGLCVAALLMLAGASSLIEMIYHRQLNEALGSVLNFAGMSLDTHDPLTWIVAAAVLLSGAVVFEWVRKRFVLEWELIQTELAQQLAREESE